MQTAISQEQTGCVCLNFQVCAGGFDDLQKKCKYFDTGDSNCSRMPAGKNITGNIWEEYGCMSCSV